MNKQNKQTKNQSTPRSNVMDVTPLAEPVNPFAFGFELMKLALRAPGITQAQVEEIRRRAAWLKKLSANIDTGHTSPILLTAMVQGALSREDRDWMLAVLQAVRSEVRAAQGIEDTEEQEQTAEEPEVTDLGDLEDYGDEPPPGA